MGRWGLGPGLGFVGECLGLICLGCRGYCVAFAVFGIDSSHGTRAVMEEAIFEHGFKYCSARTAEFDTTVEVFLDSPKGPRTQIIEFEGPNTIYVIAFGP